MLNDGIIRRGDSLALLIKGIDEQLAELQKQRDAVSLVRNALTQPAFLVLTKYADDTESGDQGYFFEKGVVVCIDGSAGLELTWDESVLIMTVSDTIHVAVSLGERKTLGQPARPRDFVITSSGKRIVFALRKQGTIAYCAELLTGPEARSTAEDIAKNGYSGSWREDEFIDLKETR